MVEKIYHEKQVKEMCALHALNNLFQNPNAFSKQELDAICYKLSPESFINPHKSILGFGNFDVNVIMAALQSKKCEAVWFDKRRDLVDLNFENITGFILNIPTEYKLGFIQLPFHRKHWIAVRRIEDLYYNLDSKLDAPEVIGKEKELLNYLSEQVDCKEKELFVVVSSDVEKTSAWKKM